MYTKRVTSILCRYRHVHQRSQDDNFKFFSTNNFIIGGIFKVDESPETNRS